MATCLGCEKPLTIHCGSVHCGWWLCRNEFCTWLVYAPRLRRRLNRTGAVTSYTTTASPPVTPEETP